MIYLDYSATTPVDKNVLEEFSKFNTNFFANPNSNHELGLLSKSQIDRTTEKIEKILNCSNYEVIYTSGATESNNLAIKGFALSNSHRGKHIISSPYEHSSITSCLSYLEKNGFDIDILGLDDSGLVDLDELDRIIRPDTILVSIALINSELGIKQDMNKLITIIKKHPTVRFHSDMTQAIGKLRVNLKGVDLISFSGHKIYGLKGVGVLLRKKSINLTPVIHGGRSTSIFRGGTPPAPLIYSLGVALQLAYQDFPDKLSYIQRLHDYLIVELLPKIANYHINYLKSIPQIINISFPDIKASKLQKELSKKNIYISTQTACSSDSSFSDTVRRVTKSVKYAESSVRISLSHLTTKEELVKLVDSIKDIINENS